MIIDLSEFRQKFNEYIENIKIFGCHVILRKNGKEIAVICPIDNFSEIIAKEKIAELKQVTDLIKKEEIKDLKQIKQIIKKEKIEELKRIKREKELKPLIEERYTVEDKDLEPNEKVKNLMQKNILTLNEASFILQLSPTTLGHLEKLGVIKFLRMGGSVRITVSEVKRFQNAEKNSYSITEAAKLLNLSRSRLTKLIQSGEIHAVKILNKYKITQQDIEKFLKETTLT